MHTLETQPEKHKDLCTSDKQPACNKHDAEKISASDPHNEAVLQKILEIVNSCNDRRGSGAGENKKNLLIAKDAFSPSLGSELLGGLQHAGWSLRAALSRFGALRTVTESSSGKLRLS